MYKHFASLTDLAVLAVDPVTGEPANVFIQPSLSHAKLERGESIRIVVYPIFTAEDAAQAALPSGRMASPAQVYTAIDLNLEATGGGVKQSQPVSTGCPAGKSIFTVDRDNCTPPPSPGGDWYCTNRAKIWIPLYPPPFGGPGSGSSAELRITFGGGDGVLPHDGQISLNGNPIGSFADQVPEGQLFFPVDPSYLTEGEPGLVSQNVEVDTQHPNPGHYSSTTDLELEVTYDHLTTYVCAETQEQAEQAFDQAFGCQAPNNFNPETDVPDGAVNTGGCKGTIDNECPETGNGTQGKAGDPINTRTGAFSLAYADISVPTSAGTLAFQRVYSSATTERNVTLLGFGWTHNHEAKLIFPEDSLGMEGYILVQGFTGNESLFKIEADGSYSPGPGVIATLTRSETPDVTYTLTISNNSVLTFDESGRITARVDEIGNEFAFTYDELSGLLTQVSADNGDNIHSDDYGVTLQVDNLTVEGGASITANALGYPGMKGPGAGVGTSDTGNAGSGAGHGGNGGSSSTGNTGGSAYDDEHQPAMLGRRLDGRIRPRNGSSRAGATPWAGMRSPPVSTLPAGLLK